MSRWSGRAAKTRTSRALRILPLALALAAAAGCDGEPYVLIRPAPPYPLLQPGDTVQLVAVYGRDHVVFPFASSIQGIYDSRSRPESFTWRSSNAAAAAVDQRGMIRALSVGVSEIRATAEGVRSRPDTVTVVQVP